MNLGKLLNSIREEMEKAKELSKEDIKRCKSEKS